MEKKRIARALFFVLVLLVAVISFAFAQDRRSAQTVTLPQVTFYSVRDDGTVRSMMEIRNRAGETMVVVDLDGKVLLGPNYKADDAARAFWEAIVKAAPKVCEGVGK